MDVVLENLEAMEQFAQEVAVKLSPLTDSATIIALSGDLGAGKTTFVQYLATAFGIDEHVTSPTYVIEKVYELSGQIYERLVHIDAYRLNSAHELLVLGWEELRKDRKTLILIEWPERVANVMPANTIRITLEGSGDTRTVRYDNKDI